MNKAEFLSHYDQMCGRAKQLSERKNNDYASPDDHEADPMAPFRNFTACERLGICSTEQGILVRMCDKVMRLINLLQPDHISAVTDESIEDTLDDLHNYTVILSAYKQATKEIA